MGLLSLTSLTSQLDDVLLSVEELVDEIDVDFSHLAQSYDDDGVHIKNQRRIVVSENIQKDTSTPSIAFSLYLSSSQEEISPNKKCYPDVILWEHNAISHQHLFHLF